MARLLCTVSYKIPIQKEDIGTMQSDSGLSQDIFITIIERLGWPQKRRRERREREGGGGRDREREACI